MGKSLGRYKPRLVHDQNGKCFYCHLRLGEDVTVEHLKARKLGGQDNYGNLRAAHAKCNSGVGHLDVEVKLMLHRIGGVRGSDAFFRELTKIQTSQRRKKKVKKLEAKKAMQARILDDFLEDTEDKLAATRQRAAVRKMLERRGMLVE
jgi:hypothetical protein